MRGEERVQKALDLIRAADGALVGAKHVIDPVGQRRHLVRIATTLRNAANVLDDHGYLTE